jgi:hypothetical protein
MLAVRGVGLPEDAELRGAVAITVHLPAGSAQVAEDGAVTATVLLGPDEALGVVAWIREASEAARTVGPPLFDWTD